MTHELPSYHSDDEFIGRAERLKEIIELGIEPYPSKFTPKDHSDALEKEYNGQEVGHSDDGAAGTTPIAIVAGRMVAYRGMGKNAFAHIMDSSGKIQIMFNRDITKVDGLKEDAEIKPNKFIDKMLGLGDFIGVEGHLFRTQKGELTIYAHKLTVLCKTLLPLPSKHHGLKDVETRYRKRWLDLIANPEVKETFRMRSRILKLTRNHFEEQGFMEVETPVLQTLYGGAAAKPFTTELNALKQEMFMRISLEIALKKLVVGGLDRVFEIGKAFRNEGIDKTHNPEFSMLEAYAAYTDYNDMMVLTETLFEKIALDLYGTTTLDIGTSDGEVKQLELKAPWRRLSMRDAIKEYGNVNVDEHDDTALRSILKERTQLPPEKYEKAARGLLVAMLFEELAEPHLFQPHHIIDHPIETTPLCKLHRDPKLREERYVERFESFILGGEFCNAYTELNDPVLQRELLEQQNDMREQGDEEATPLDESFIEAICQGLPPCGGLGIGIDRMVMLFTKSVTIRDVLYFPVMRENSPLT